MKFFDDHSEPGIAGSRNRRGFSLVEIMVAVALMSVIILGLMAMFGQTQRAFRLGMNQTDVLESGRLATDIISRELEQITPAGKQTNATPGFYAELMDSRNTSKLILPGTSALRVNSMSDLFFLTRQNQEWTGIGYFVRLNNKVSGSFGPVGTLYRYETNLTAWAFEQNPYAMQEGFKQARNGGTNVSRLVDGVVHFEVRAYDTNGIWINGFEFPPNVSSNRISTNLMNYVIGNYDYYFTSNAVPAFVELEIGVLEQQSYERYKAIPVLTAQSNYLSSHAGNVHIFRQRIPIRNVDVTAYQ